MALIDQALAVEGVRRAWPCDGAIAVEVVDRYGRLRAGRVSDSGPVLSPYACDPVLGRIPLGDGTLVVHRHGRRAVVVGAEDLGEAAGDNPRELEVVVVPGDSGSFTLEEDDGSAEPGPDRVARTRMALTWPDTEDEDGGDAVLRIRLEGATDVVPDSRKVTVRLLSCRVAGAWLGVGEQACRLATEEVDGDGFTLGAGTLVRVGELSRQELADGVGLVLRGTRQEPMDWRDEVHTILDAARVEYMAKDLAWAAVQRGLSGTALLGEMEALGLPETLRAAVAEVLPHS